MNAVPKPDFQEFSRRSEMYKARAEALDQAKEQLRSINAIHTVWTALTVIIGLVVLWLNPSIRWGIGILVVLFLIRWIGNIIVHMRFTGPEMKRIDREFPAPPPREERSV